jgi:hypothetical protein
MIIVLDNARDAGQARPLLSSSPGCLALVTSHARLTGLAVAENAELVALDVLSQEEARQLLAIRLGVGRLSRDRAQAREGHLPFSPGGRSS